MNEDLIRILESRIDNNTLKNILYIYDVLDSSGYMEIIDAINNLGNINEIDIDTTVLDVKIVMYLRRGLLEYFRNMGIICDELVLSLLSLNFIVDIISSLKQISILDGDEALNILENVPNDTNNSIDLLFYYVSSINPYIEDDKFFSLIDDVYDGTIEAITNKLEERSQHFTFNKIKQPDIDILPIMNFIVDKKIRTLPDLLNEFVLNKKITEDKIINNFADLKSYEYKKLKLLIIEMGMDDKIIIQSLMSLILIYFYGMADSNNDDSWYNTLLLDLMDKIDNNYDFKTKLDEIIDLYKSIDGMLVKEDMNDEKA